MLESEPGYIGGFLCGRAQLRSLRSLPGAVHSQSHESDPSNRPGSEQAICLANCDRGQLLRHDGADLEQCMQEYQAGLAAGASSLQPAVADLVQRVISESSAADVKAQRRADALSAACGVVEALQRLLPAGGQTGLDGRAGALAEAAAEQLSALQPTPGKVGWDESLSIKTVCSFDLA